MNDIQNTKMSHRGRFSLTHFESPGTFQFDSLLFVQCCEVLELLPDIYMLRTVLFTKAALNALRCLAVVHGEALVVHV